MYCILVLLVTLHDVDCIFSSDRAACDASNTAECMATSSQSECEYYGCCYRENNSPRCYQGSASVQTPTTGSECNIEVNDRKSCFSINVQESECLAEGCCYENGLCFYSTSEVGGFNRRLGLIGGFDIEVVQLSLVDCARVCLSLSNCLSFAYTSNFDANGNSCYLKTKTVKTPAQSSVIDVYLYDKIAVPGYNCVMGACELSSLFATDDLIPACQTKCDTDGSCSGFVIKHRNGASICTGMSSMCNYNDLVVTTSYAWTCYRGAMTHSSQGNSVYFESPDDKHNAQLLRDGNLTSGIVVDTIGFTGFRFAWPVLNQYDSSFIVNLTGHNMVCSNPSQIMVYIPKDVHGLPHFYGRHKLCPLLMNTPSLCQFACSCGHYFCPAVYLVVADGTADVSSQMSIFEVEFI